MELHDETQKPQGITLPLSDYFITSLYTLISPLAVGICLILIFFSLSNLSSVLSTLLPFLLVLIVITGFIFWKSYRELRFHALKVNYFHFTPSLRDLILFLIRQVYSFVFIGLFLIYILSSVLENQVEVWGYFAVALALSFILQGGLIGISLRSKRNLLSTAQEEVSTNILDQLNNEFADSGIIHQYRFADVQIPSLFLSAGVMSYGSKYICLISRYFNWKLSESELVAVLGHERGHIAKNHIKKQYGIIGIEGLLRSLRYFVILVYFQFYLQMDFFLQILFWVCVVLVYSASGFLSIASQYRVFLQEIRADFFSGKSIGFDILASTLHKLPSVLPLPISSTQTDFLRFRVSLLRSYIN